VLAPHHLWNLAFFEIANASIALQKVEQESQRADSPLFGAITPGAAAGILGHSLGGVVGFYQWEENPQFTSLIQLASVPPSQGLKVPSGKTYLSLTGETDGLLEVDRAQTEFKTVQGPKTFAIVKGMNHFDWVTDATQAELARDGTPAANLEQTRQQANALIDTWLDATLKQNPTAQTRLKGSFAGLTIERATK
jgi:hypothetical protein